MPVTAFSPPARTPLPLMLASVTTAPIRPGKAGNGSRLFSIVNLFHIVVATIYRQGKRLPMEYPASILFGLINRPVQTGMHQAQSGHQCPVSLNT